MGERNDSDHADSFASLNRNGVESGRDGREFVRRWSLVVIAVIAVIAALRLGSVVLLPLVVGVWLAMLLWPVHSRALRFLPAWLAAIATSAALFLSIGAFGAFAWYAGDRAIEHVQSNEESYSEEYSSGRERVVGWGVPEKWLPRWEPSEESGPEPKDERFEPRSRSVPPDRADEELFGQSRSEVLSWITGGLRSGVSILAAMALTLIFTVFSLVEFPTWRAWSSTTFGAEPSEFVGGLSRRISRIVRRYFVAKLASGVISGAATAVFLWTMDVPMALVWGLLALLMNFIPNIGAVLSGVPPTLLAFLELGVAEGLIVGGGLLAIEMLVGNFIDPMIQGDALDLSPFVVLASLLFWGWLWGIAGAVLAPTLTASLVAVYKAASMHRWSLHASHRTGGSEDGVGRAGGADVRR